VPERTYSSSVTIPAFDEGFNGFTVTPTSRAMSDAPSFSWAANSLLALRPRRHATSLSRRRVGCLPG
jgi:hypothetical protein